jgi:cytidylate kinase
VSFVVTIDGPAAAGKSSTARAIAQRLGWRYLDTGAFYRALALKALRNQTELTPFNAESFAQATAIGFSGDPMHPHVMLDGADVTEAIRSPQAGEAASRVATLAEVRRVLVKWQRAIAEREPLVGEGRDLGTVVFPNAQVKLFLDADLQTRAHRRMKELVRRGLSARFEDVLEEMRSRDERDRSRADSPLKPASDATVLDTSGMDLDRQVEAALAVIRAHPACPPGAEKPAPDPDPPPAGAPTGASP